jgi:hypothetical protein
MSILQITRKLVLAVALATYVSSTIAQAGPDQKNGMRQGPPPEAFEVCAEEAEGSVCKFAAPRGDVTGTCIVPPRDQEVLVCAPEGGPPRDHAEM